MYRQRATAATLNASWPKSSRIIVCWPSWTNRAPQSVSFHIFQFLSPLPLILRIKFLFWFCHFFSPIFFVFVIFSFFFLILKFQYFKINIKIIFFYFFFFLFFFPHSLYRFPPLSLPRRLKKKKIKFRFITRELDTTTTTTTTYSRLLDSFFFFFLLRPFLSERRRRTFSVN